MSNDEMYVIEDCFCARYLHEKEKYPREGLVEKKLKKGDIVVFTSEYMNFYGYYYKVEMKGERYDIEPKYLRTLKELRLEKIKKLKRLMK